MKMQLVLQLVVLLWAVATPAAVSPPKEHKAKAVEKELAPKAAAESRPKLVAKEAPVAPKEEPKKPPALRATSAKKGKGKEQSATVLAAVPPLAPAAAPMEKAPAASPPVAAAMTSAPAASPPAKAAIAGPRPPAGLEFGAPAASQPASPAAMPPLAPAPAAAMPVAPSPAEAHLDPTVSTQSWKGKEDKAKPKKTPKEWELAQMLPSVSLKFEIESIDYHLLHRPEGVSPILVVGDTSKYEDHHEPTFHTIASDQMEQDGMDVGQDHQKTNSDILEQAVHDTVLGILKDPFGFSQGSIDPVLHPLSEGDSTGVHVHLSAKSPAAGKRTFLVALDATVRPENATTLRSGGGGRAGGRKSEPEPEVAAMTVPEKEKLRDGTEGDGAEGEEKDVVGTLPVIDVSFEPGAPPQGMGASKRIPTTTITKVNMIDHPGTGGTSLPRVEAAFREAIEDGSLQERLSYEIARAFGEASIIVGTVFEDTGSVQPYNATACAQHLSSLVQSFSAAYTRANVPQALYHACETFSTSKSFSHDVEVGIEDRIKCRQATKRFVNLWQYGHGKVNYDHYCIELCHIKHGSDAIQCDASKYLKMGE